MQFTIIKSFFTFILVIGKSLTLVAGFFLVAGKFKGMWHTVCLLSLRNYEYCATWSFGLAGNTGSPTGTQSHSGSTLGQTLGHFRSRSDWNTAVIIYHASANPISKNRNKLFQGLAKANSRERPAFDINQYCKLSLLASSDFHLYFSEFYGPKKWTNAE